MHVGFAELFDADRGTGEADLLCISRSDLK
jgi:hypothetical protein